jgi:Uma2 family endonuclease
MNIALTRATEGFARRAFTVEDVRRMIEAGVIGPDENFELIEGDVVVMAAKSIRHERIKVFVSNAVVLSAPDRFSVAVECTLQLSDNVLVEPDIAVVADDVFTFQGDGKEFAKPQARDVILIVEIAVSSLAYDRDLKARLYARCGIREYWVIDAGSETTWVYSEPNGDGWGSVVERGRDETLTTQALPGFAIRLSDIT